MKRWFARPGAVAVVLWTIGAGSAAQTATDPIAATAQYDGNAFVDARARIGFSVSRLPAEGEGRLAVMVGTADLTALFERRGTAFTFRGGEFSLPAGEHELRVFLVSAAGWQEVGKAPLKVLTARGFQKASITPAGNLNNKGQLAEGHSGTSPAPDRDVYQDFGGTAGIQTHHIRGDWTVETQTNFVGTGNRPETLRFAEKGYEASRFDLSDFVVRLQRPGAALAAGHVSFGASRHLINSFGSRGLTASVTRGPATVSLGALNGSSIVGWDNITGLNRSDHRMLTGSIGLEVKPSRPGAGHFDVSILDGSVLPSAGYSEGGIVDAERSEGASVQFAASTPSQRIRLGGGYTLSRFRNGDDPQLEGENAIVQAPERRKNARFGELSVGLLQDASLLAGLKASLTANLRHERVQPLFRSLAAQTRADIEENAWDLTGTLDAIAFQFAQTRARDNLDDVASILTTNNHGATGQISTQLAPLFRVSSRAWLLPSVTIGFNRTHQFGGDLPPNSDFQASHVPDQVSEVRDYSAQWQSGRVRFGYRHNRSFQDNRQPGREAADLAGRTSSISLGLTARTNIDLSAEGSLERQENREAKQIGRLRRVGLSADWRVFDHSGIAGSLSLSHSEDEASATENDQAEGRLELSHRFDVLRNAQSTKRGQLFIRFARQSAELNPLDAIAAGPAAQARAAWTVVTGVNFRLF